MRSLTLGLYAAILCGCAAPEPMTPAASPAPAKPKLLKWSPAVTTEPVGEDPDDPAIWVHPTRPELSLVIATNKAGAPNGAIVVYDLQGRILQRIANVDRPNNIDIRQNVVLGGKTYDIAVATERYRNALRIFTIDGRTRRITQVGAPMVFADEVGDLAAPMGIALYVRKSDGALFAIVGRKSGPREGYLWQYRVQPDFTIARMRQFGRFSGKGEIEAIVADDELGVVHYADEGVGIRTYRADPIVPKADQEVTVFGRYGYKGDREGLAIYKTGPESGYLISTDQIAGSSRYFLNDRQNPGEPIAVIEGGADETDGVEAIATPLGPGFPAGMLAAMNSKGRNFFFFAWQQP